MKFCSDHWARLREKIDDRGLTSLVSKSGETAIQKELQTLQEGKVSRDTFDPLMGAFWAICGNVMRLIDGTGNSPLYLLVDGPEDPVTVEGYEQRTWPRCPICYINLAHEVSCTNPRCGLPKTNGYDWMLDRAADDALMRARELGLAPPPS